MAYMIDIFPTVRRRDEEKHDGDYRTKRVDLEIHDSILESIRTGRPCQSRRYPPPAGPCCSHPPQDGETRVPGVQLADYWRDGPRDGADKMSRR